VVAQSLISDRLVVPGDATATATNVLGHDLAITKENRMKRNVTLVITSLLSILLLTLHVTDDIVRGISKAEPANIALVVLVMLPDEIRE